MDLEKQVDNFMNNINNLINNIKVNYLNKNKFVKVLTSNFFLDILFILYKKGLIEKYSIEKNSITIKLKYYNNEPVIKEFFNYSKPNFKKYLRKNEIIKLSKKHDYLLISTTSGLILLDNNSNITEGGQILFGLNLNT